MPGQSTKGGNAAQVSRKTGRPSESVGRAVRMVASAPHVVCTRLDDEQAAA